MSYRAAYALCAFCVQSRPNVFSGGDTVVLFRLWRSVTIYSPHGLTGSPLHYVHCREWNPGKAINPRGPFQLALLGANKQVLRATFKELRSQDLKVQFKAV